MKRILAVCPHPDDESIGCGGTLRDHVVSGDHVRIVFLTSGEGGGHGRSIEETVRVREAEALSAAGILGVRDVEFWREPDGAVRATPALVARLRNALVEFAPDVIYVPHRHDGHADHRAASRLVRSAVIGAQLTPAPDVLQYEVWTPLQKFDRIVDVGAHIDVKIAAIRSHASQCDVLAFDDAALGLTRWRGEMFCWPVGEYAEVFALLPLRG